MGANPEPEATGIAELPGKSNYFIGNDPEKWRTNVPNYAKVEYRDVYPGIDLIYYGNQRQLEYDFVVAPRADPEVIRLSFEGAGKLEVDTQGDLVLHTAREQVRLRKPVVYQETDGVRLEISGGYVLKSKHQVGFEVAAYDPSKAVIIDPVLEYSTYLGGEGSDEGQGIAVDTSGNVYVTGKTTSVDFPTTSGVFQTTYNGGLRDAFVTKLNASGTALIYSTYLGGTGGEGGSGIAVDTSGNAYVTGTTFSADFPTTPGALQRTITTQPAFVTKLNATGDALVYSTFLGGSGIDEPSGIAVDPAGNAYITGGTQSADFPTTPDAF